MFQVDDTQAPATAPTQTPATAEPVDIATLTPGSKEYNDAMVAKARAARGETADEPYVAPEQEQTSDRPQWLPEKFKSPEDMAKAYAALEKKLSTGKADEPQAQAEGDAQAEATWDYSALTQEFTSNNLDLTQDTKDKLYAVHGQELVDSHLAGLRAQVELNQYKVCEAVGVTLPQVREMMTWAATNLSKGEIAMFNKATQGDLDEAAAAIGLLKDKYAQGNAKGPQRQITGGNAPTTTEGFSSKAELVAAVGDPRYAKDPNYRALVAKRIAATKNVVL